MPIRNARKHGQKRCFRYVFLSSLLTFVVLISTGCTALLTGDNRVAYDLMLKASEYFKYPSSVQIVSGEVADDSMFCVIKAKNSSGSYRSEAYFVSDSGYPLEYYSSFCYSDSLNCDLINQALASHFGSNTASSTNVFSNMIGGNTMSSGAIVFFYIVILIVFFCLNGLLASNASDIAKDKGYDKKKWFHMCFWLGFISYIIIAAMPDLTLRSLTQEMIKLQQSMLIKADSISKANADNKNATVLFKDLPNL